MARFNSKRTSRMAVPGQTLNAAGGISFERTLKQEVVSILLTSMMSGRDAYYESDAAAMERKEAILARAAKEELEFLARAVVFARTKGNLRSVSHFASVLLAENAGSNPIVRKALSRVVLRVDDMREIVGLWDKRHPKDETRALMIPNSMRRAFRDVLESGKFDEFQYSRYAGNSGVRLKDVVKMTHPSPKRAHNGDLFGRILDDKLGIARTMESTRSGGESTQESFSDLLKTRKLGYMAALKNIRNALEGGITDEVFGLWKSYIANPVAVSRSRVLPFRFLDAYRELRDATIDYFRLGEIKTAFDAALVHSLGNLGITDEGERIAIVIDDSGSMDQCVVTQSTNFQIACLIAALIQKAHTGQSAGYKFSTTCRRTDFSTNSILDFVFNEKAEGGATYVTKPFELLTRTRTAVDKIIMVTDLQLYEDGYGCNEMQTLLPYFDQYRKLVSPGCKLLFWSLTNYSGGTPIKLKNNMMEIYGLSEKLIPFIRDLWDDGAAFIKRIEAVEL